MKENLDRLTNIYNTSALRLLLTVQESQSSVPILKFVTQTLISSPAETRIRSCKNVQQK